jgi:glutamate-5-semialdehyde dehydrogenase
VARADGDHDEPMAETLAINDLGHEWEWEATPEVSLKIVDDLDEAIALFNKYSPQFIVSLIAEDPAAHARLAAEANAAFIGDGFTRWVDGQYAFDRPELGLSSWQAGRLFARGGVLSGDGVFTVKTRMTQADMTLRR